MAVGVKITADTEVVLLPNAAEGADDVPLLISAILRFSLYVMNDLVVGVC